MKRRDLLKSLTMVAGGSLCSGSGWSQATTPSDEKRQVKLVVPVRALIRRNGALFQPVEITLDNHGSGAVAITRVELRCGLSPAAPTGLIALAAR